MTAAKLRNLAQMSKHDVATMLKAMALKILSLSQCLSLIHTHVDFSTAESGCTGGNHLSNQGVCLILIAQQNIPGVMDISEGIPVEDGVEMRQGLDARNYLNAEERCIVVDLPELLLGIAASEITKVGIVGEFIDVLRIEQERVIPHQSQASQKLLHGFHRRHSIS